MFDLLVIITNNSKDTHYQRQMSWKMFVLKLKSEITSSTEHQARHALKVKATKRSVQEKNNLNFGCNECRVG